MRSVLKRVSAANSRAGPSLAGTEKNKNKVQKISTNIHAYDWVMHTTFVQCGSGIVSVGLLKEVGKCQRGKARGEKPECGVVAS